MVRGVQVPFSPSDIDAFYGLKDMGQGERESYLHNMDYEEVIETLPID